MSPRRTTCLLTWSLADVAGEGRGLHAGGDGRSDLGTRPGRGRAVASPGASSGARQRPAAVPRVSGPRARPAASQRAIAPVRGSAGPVTTPRIRRRSA